MPTLSNVTKIDLSYDCGPSPTLQRFHASPAYVRVLMGCLGSGKTFACCHEIFYMAMKMPPCKDNVRRSTACFVRDTTTNLADTTMKTWLKLFPEDPRKSNDMYTLVTRVCWSNPMDMHVCIPLDDGTLLDLLIYCRHQACAADAENLKSLELSFAFVSEANKVPKESVDMLIGRVGRFPDKQNLKIDPSTGEPYKPRFGIVMDSNMTDDQHYLYHFSEVKTPDGWEFFRQPPAMFAEMGPNGKMRYTPNRGQKLAQGILPADNIARLNEGWGYYKKQIAGKDHQWIRVFIMAEWGSIMDGCPVYPAYNDLVHYRNGDIPFDRTKTLFLGFDFGLHPSVVFMQMSDKGQLQIIDEIDGGDEKMGMERLWETKLRAKLVNEYGFGKGTQIFAICDPAGGQRNQVDENTCIAYLMRQGLSIVPCHTNAQGARMEAVDYFLRRLADGGIPAFVVSKRAQKIRKGFCGGYFFKRKEQHKDEVYAGTPADNSFTHLQDAVQYVCHALKNPTEYDIKWRNTTSGWFGNTVEKKTQSVGAPINMQGY